MANIFPSAGFEEASTAFESSSGIVAPDPGEETGDPTVATVATCPDTLLPINAGGLCHAVLMGLLQKVPRTSVEMACDRVSIIGDTHLSLGQALDLVALAKPKSLASKFTGRQIVSKDYVVLRWLVALGSEAAGMLPLDMMGVGDVSTFHTNLRRAATDHDANIACIKKRIVRAKAAAATAAADQAVNAQALVAVCIADLGDLEQVHSSKFMAASYLPKKYRPASEAKAAAAGITIVTATTPPLNHPATDPLAAAEPIVPATVNAPAATPAVDKSDGVPTPEQTEVERLQAELDAECDRHDAIATQSDMYVRTMARFKKENQRVQTRAETMAYNASKWRQKYALLADQGKRAEASWKTQLDAAQQEAKQAAVKHRREVEKLNKTFANLQSNLEASWANEAGLKERLKEVHERERKATSPLRSMQQECEAQQAKIGVLEGKSMSVGKELAHLRELATLLDPAHPTMPLPNLMNVWLRRLCGGGTSHDGGAHPDTQAARG
jgi:hypothetical protein